jgi:serine protease Do
MSAGSYIQTDAFISGENIGGALLDLSGQVIGINAGSASAGTLMMGFALPINSAKESISRMLGEVLISETEAETETEAGVLSETEKETAALPEAFSETEAELQTESRRETEGRVQLHISGQNPEGAVSETEKLSPATEKALSETEESERQKEAPALIETEGLSAPKELPEATKTRGLLGIHGAAISEEYQIVNRMPAGIYVTEVDPGSGAQMAGILNEDVITAIDGVQVTSIEELRGALDGTKAGDIVSVTIIRADDHEKYTVEKTVRVTLQ